MTVKHFENFPTVRETQSQPIGIQVTGVLKCGKRGKELLLILIGYADARICNLQQQIVSTLTLFLHFSEYAENPDVAISSELVRV